MSEVKYLKVKEELTSKQAAEYMGIKVATLYGWVQGGIAPHHVYRFGRLYFRKEDLDQFIKANTEVRRCNAR